MQAFEYVAPATLAEAIQALAHTDARPLAGGTDLTTQLKEGRRHHARIVDLKRLPELGGIEFGPDTLHIGAAAPLRDIYRHPLIQKEFPILVHACSIIGSTQIQSRATLGGNVCNAAPSADGSPALIVLGAAAHIAGPKGERQLPLEAIFTGPGRTQLEPGEVLVKFVIPRRKGRFGAQYLRFIPRNEMDIAVAGAGCAVELGADGRCSYARIALSAVAPVPLRAEAAEQALLGHALTPERIAQAAQLAAQAAKPISDVRGSAEYRIHLVGVLTRRALEQARAQAE
ncbi:MAG TPA: xanthine dehydrogenase family protein subunit M [Limnochordia bacterium]|nr:xanthine dehydrogenase family protein subunit M [Limnochordia bacterium]